MNREKLKQESMDMCDNLRREFELRKLDRQDAGSIVEIINLIENLLVNIEDLENKM